MKVHPVFILGIILVAAPAITPIFGLKLWGWISGVGIILILIGGILTAIKGDD